MKTYPDKLIARREKLLSAIASSKAVMETPEFKEASNDNQVSAHNQVLHMEFSAMCLFSEISNLSK